jgi:hypothetical protein
MSNQYESDASSIILSQTNQSFVIDLLDFGCDVVVFCYLFGSTLDRVSTTHLLTTVVGKLIIGHKLGFSFISVLI